MELVAGGEAVEVVSAAKAGCPTAMQNAREAANKLDFMSLSGEGLLVWRAWAIVSTGCWIALEEMIVLILCENLSWEPCIVS